MILLGEVAGALDVFRTRLDTPSVAEVRTILTGVDCKDPSLAVQSQAEDADINVIVKRFGITGQVPQGVRPPTFEDFGDSVFDFQTAQNALVEAQRSFMAMPADVRKRFDNDPQQFVAFCSDEANLPEMRKLGLAVPEKVIEPEKIQKVEIVGGEKPAK